MSNLLRSLGHAPGDDAVEALFGCDLGGRKYIKDAHRLDAINSGGTAPIRIATPIISATSSRLAPAASTVLECAAIHPSQRTTIAMPNAMSSLVFHNRAPSLIEVLNDCSNALVGPGISFASSPNREPLAIVE
jgi:hypothetical protein